MDQHQSSDGSSNLAFRPSRKLVGPDVKVTASSGVVPTRSESKEEIKIRRQYGVGKY